MGQPGQTPGAFLLAGGTGFFSAACVAALAKCGLSPDDFGSYDHVKEQIRAAKRRIMDYKQAKKRGQKPLPPEPTAHDRLLAKSEAGHLRQNALFQRKRGDGCQNERPVNGVGGAFGYHSDLAPCGPHMGSSKDAGTTHWGQKKLEEKVSEGRKAGAPVSAGEIKQVSLKTSELTAGGVSKEQLEAEGRGAKRRRTNEQKAREASAAALSGASAGTADKAGDGKAGAGDLQTAADCIEAFTEAGMDAMRQQVMNDYSEENYGKTKDRLKKEEEAALERKKKAEKDFDEALERARNAPKGKADWDAVQRAGMERAHARQDHDQAKKANDSAECLRKQAKDLKEQQQKEGALQPMTGSVPKPGVKRQYPDVGTGDNEDIP